MRLKSRTPTALLDHWRTQWAAVVQSVQAPQKVSAGVLTPFWQPVPEAEPRHSMHPTHTPERRPPPWSSALSRPARWGGALPSTSSWTALRTNRRWPMERAFPTPRGAGSLPIFSIAALSFDASKGRTVGYGSPPCQSGQNPNSAKSREIIPATDRLTRCRRRGSNV